MTAMFDGYVSSGPAYDEMYDGAELRPPYARLRTSLDTMTTPDLVGPGSRRCRPATSTQGVTFDFGGEERPFPLDLMPRVIEHGRLVRRSSRASQQRVRGARDVPRRRLRRRAGASTTACPARGRSPPPRTSTGQAAGIEPPNGVRVHVAGIDLIRDDAGEFRVLEDNVRMPSGVTYVMRTGARSPAALPEPFAEHRVRPVDDYPPRLLHALRAARPGRRRRPDRRRAHPGRLQRAPTSSTPCWPGTMGVELVEGRDLVCRRSRVLDAHHRRAASRCT